MYLGSLTLAGRVPPEHRKQTSTHPLQFREAWSPAIPGDPCLPSVQTETTGCKSYVYSFQRQDIKCETDREAGQWGVERRVCVLKLHLCTQLYPLTISLLGIQDQQLLMMPAKESSHNIISMQIMLKCSFNLTTREAEAGRSLIGGHFGLQSNFQNSHGYIAKYTL